MLNFKIEFFCLSFRITTADLNAFKLPAEGSGECVFADGFDDPFPGLREGLLDPSEPRQQLLHSR